MGLDLVHSGYDIREVTEVNEVVGVEVAHADSSYLTLLESIFEGAIGIVAIAKGLVNQHEIDVVGAEQTQAFIQATLRGVTLEVGYPDLVHDEDFITA